MTELMDILLALIGMVVFCVVGCVLGCLLDGLDRKISARLQGRVGPPLLQPYYDVRKLFEKERILVNSSQNVYVVFAFVFACLAGGIFFTGGNILLCVFIVTLSSLFYIVSAACTRSPYSEVGAARETLQVMCYEPMVLIFATAFYIATSGLSLVQVGSFDVSVAFSLPSPVVGPAILVFLGLVFVLTIKLRKSPFDLSASHHAHQEIVSGITTELSGPMLGISQMMHWCETVLFLGWVGIFFVWQNPISIVIAVIVALLVYFLEIFIDNNFARVKWQLMLGSSWVMALVAGLNIVVLTFIY